MKLYYGEFVTPDNLIGSWEGPIVSLPPMMKLYFVAKNISIWPDS